MLTERPLPPEVSDQTLAGRIAIITGASSGIGLATAERLLAAGACVVLNARNSENLNAARQSLDFRGNAVTSIVGDAADDSVLEQILAAPEKHFHQPADLIVINAGRGLAGSPLTSDPSQWEALLRVNILAVLKLMRAGVAHLLGLLAEGATFSRPLDLVVLGSSVGRHISPFSSVYGATKAAVASLAEALRREVASKGIRISLIEPGIVISDFQRVAGYDPEWFAGLVSKIGPVLSPADIARLIHFIVSQPAHVHLNDAVIRPTRQDYP